jgi:5-methylcytosine-specific restriction enzyme A
VPSLPKRPCSYPGGCPNLVEQDAGAEARCPEHQRKQAQQQQQQRGKTAERGYDAHHKRLRVACFVRDGWTCVDCGWQPELVRVFAEAALGTPPVDRVLDELRAEFASKRRHLHADHEIPIEDRPELRLVLSNYRTRCNVCHSAKTAKEDGGFGRV